MDTIILMYGETFFFIEILLSYKITKYKYSFFELYMLNS